jgi:hypothetical protein
MKDDSDIMARTNIGVGAKQNIEEERGGWGNILSEDFHDLHPLPHIVTKKISNKKN